MQTERHKGRPNVAPRGREHLIPLREALQRAEPLAPFTSPRIAAQASLLVVDLLSQGEHRQRLAALQAANVFDLRLLDSMQHIGRAMLYLVDELAYKDPTVASIGDERWAEGAIVRDKLQRLLVKVLDELDEPHLWLDAVRLSQPDDLVFDLRILAHVSIRYDRLLKTDPAFDPNLAPKARWLADALEDACLGERSAAEAALMDTLRRCYALMVPAYDELVRAGRFVCGTAPDAELPSLAAIARARRIRVRARLCDAQRAQSGPASARRTSAPPMSSQEPALTAATSSQEMPPVVVPPPLPLSPARASAPSPPSVSAVPSPAASAAVPPPLPPAPPPAPPALPAIVTDSHAAFTATSPAEDRAITTVAPAPLEIPADSPGPVDEAPSAAESSGQHPLHEPTVLRGEERAPVELEAAIGIESHFYLGFTENISHGGLFVETYKIVPIGTRLTLDLWLPEGNKVEIQGIVRWTRLPSEDGELWPGLGVQFHELSAEQEAIMEKYLFMRPPMFFEP